MTLQNLRSSVTTEETPSIKRTPNCLLAATSHDLQLLGLVENFWDTPDVGILLDWLEEKGLEGEREAVNWIRGRNMCPSMFGTREEPNSTYGVWWTVIKGDQPHLSQLWYIHFSLIPYLAESEEVDWGIAPTFHNYLSYSHAIFDLIRGLGKYWREHHTWPQ